MASAAVMGEAGEHHDLRLNRGWILLSASLGVALLGLAMVFHFTDVDEFWIHVLLHLGAAIALSGVLFFFECKYEQTSRRTRAEIRVLAQRTIDSVQAMESQLKESLDRQDAGDRRASTSFRDAPTYDALRALLARAAAVNAISSIGIRVPLPATPLYLRIGPLADGAIDMFVEANDRTELRRLSWSASQPSDSFFLALQGCLSNQGYVVSHDEFAKECGDLCALIAETLRIAIEVRTGADSGLKPIGKVFQPVTDDWYVTVAGLENVRTGHRIAVEELRNGELPQLTDGPDGAADWPTTVEIARDAWRPNPWSPLR